MGEQQSENDDTPTWDDGTDWEAEKRAASGVDDPWDEDDETPLPSDLGAC